MNVARRSTCDTSFETAPVLLAHESGCGDRHVVRLVEQQRKRETRQP